jgi:vancomycin aglycone glucosyltransferase
MSARSNHNRLRLGMDPIDDVLQYVLTDHTWLAADAALAPVPATPGRKIFQTGTWVLADRTPLPADLEAFLESGEPPVLVGFGSMPAAAGVSCQLIGAARAVGRRILVSRGWASLDVIDNAPDRMAVGDVSHDMLFPRVAAVAHHGGAGITAAAARAGIPQVITPMFGDQFYWAGRIGDLELGATTLVLHHDGGIPHGRTSESLKSGRGGAGTHLRRASPLGRRYGCSAPA